MSVDLFERYREALRRGHMAVAHGQFDEALAAYREAVSLAPDRALPYASIGQVLLRQGTAAEALAAFQTALNRAPRDEQGLRGRGESLAKLGRRTDAADVFDILADVQEAAGRTADACDSTRRALELAEQKARRRRLQDLIDRLRLIASDQPAEQALSRALRTLEKGRPGARPVLPGDHAGPGGSGRPRTGRSGGPETEDAAWLAEDSARTAAIDAPDPGPPPDPVALTAEAELLLDSGDHAGALERYLAAAAAFGNEGLIAAAVDACYVALAFAPDNADVHLRLVELYLSAGWNVFAADKLALLGRLTELDNRQGHARARIVVLAAEQFPDDPRLQRLTTAR